ALRERFADAPKSAAEGDPDAAPEAPLAAQPTAQRAELIASPTRAHRKIAWRQVAILTYAAAQRDPGRACPPPTAPGWEVAPLLRQGASATLLKEGAALPTALERFCEYRWTNAPAPATTLPFGPGPLPGGVLRMDPDLDVVEPQAPAPTQLIPSPLPPAPLTPTSLGDRTIFLGEDGDLRAALADAYREHAAAKAGPAPVPEPADAPLVAVVDTASYGDSLADYAATAPRRRHGLAMAGLIRDVRCPHGDAACEARIFFAQAFPYSADDPAPREDGGPLGSLGALARAVGEATLRWRATPAPRGPLIVNLSLGWDTKHGALSIEPQEHLSMLKGDVEAVPATVQAVHAAITWATCNRALVIAAAGNNDAGPCGELGPMAPAAWEQLRAPRPAECDAAFDGDVIVYDDEGGARSDGSLLYAAGGLTHVNAPIPNARVDSLPTRALPAFQAVASSIPGRSDSWTGTSVAAATLSGLAARTWPIKHPNAADLATPQELMAAIDATGATMPDLRQSVRRYDRQPGPVRRIDGFTLVAKRCDALGLLGAACPNPYAPPSVANLHEQLGQRLAVEQRYDSSRERPAAEKSLTCADATVQCGGEGPVSIVRCGDLPPQTSPALDEPWTRPQPDTPICPVCPIKKRTRLYISPNPTNTGAVTLEAPALGFALRDGSFLLAGLEDIRVSPGTTVIVNLDRVLVPYGVGAAATPLSDILEDEDVTQGELGFTVTDAAGRATQELSAVAIYDD
ncbi:MAG: S8/S53 family peptidase, partial [Myxococcales bacterium]|nr:S8/S53 family peptidase [Myxococcales bacterium]